MKTFYEKFKEVVNSQKTKYRYDAAEYGEEIACFQMYGMNNEQVVYCWQRYKRERRKYPDLYKWYRFSVSSACLRKAGALR